MFWWRMSCRSQTTGVQVRFEGGEQFLEGCAIQFFTQCFGSKVPVSGNHVSLHQTEKPGVTIAFLVRDFSSVVLGPF